MPLRPLANAKIIHGAAAGEVPAQSERLAENAATLAVAGRDCERLALHRLFAAIQSIVALLDCTDAARRGDLVFRKKFPTALVAQSSPRLCGRDRFFFGRV